MVHVDTLVKLPIVGLYYSMSLRDRKLSLMHKSG